MEVCQIDPHPLLVARVFATTFPKALGDLSTPEPILRCLRSSVEAPLPGDEALRSAIRTMLRHGGYKPSGRGKPASEYLLRAAQDGSLASINLAVDACNAVSLQSGFPISVIDLSRAVPPFRIRTCAAGESYVFNSAGQVIDLEGLLCLCDAVGPCANGVKDSQRTKTDASTRHTLTVVWGAVGLEKRLDAVVDGYRELLAGTGAVTTLS